MVNKALLCSQMVLQGISTKDLASALGKSMSTVYRKINGKTEFMAPEILECCKILSLTPELKDEIFFGQKIS